MNPFFWILDKLMDIIDPPEPPTTAASLQPKIFAKRLREDLESPNLYVGKIMDDGSIKCEVMEVRNTNIHVKILQINWDRLGTYLDVGKVYPVFKHRSQFLNDHFQMWEISSKRMKRNTSQVLLAWEKGVGWTWDLDM